MFGALSPALPARLTADGAGGSTLPTFAGLHAGRPFVFSECVMGTWGASRDADGQDGVPHMASNPSNVPVEMVEADYPLRIERCGLVADTGGAGRRGGGLALRRDYRILTEDCFLGVRSDKRFHPPHGLFGGREGAPSRNDVVQGDTHTVLPPLPTLPITLRQGAVFSHTMAGGGGYGDAFAREPERVLDDVLDGRVSVAAARDAYGVALTADGRAVDHAATARLRAAGGPARGHGPDRRLADIDGDVAERARDAPSAGVAVPFACGLADPTPVNAPARSHRPVLGGARGAVAAAHPLSVSAGTAMLAAGGSAADAAVAAQDVLCVLSPDNCGLGGDQLCLVRQRGGVVTAVNGTGAAPRGMSRADDDGGNSVTVPGIVDAWVAMNARWGRLALAVVLEPAVRISEEGFVVGTRLAEAFRDHSGRLLRGGGEGWTMRTATAGALPRQPALAAVLARIGREGRAAVYAGSLAEAIAAAVQRSGGALDGRGLADHATVIAEPLTIAWRGHRLHVQPPVSQGVLLAMAQAAEERLGPLSPRQRDHVGVELMESSFAFRDRSRESHALLAEPLAFDLDRAGLRDGPRAYLHTAGVAVADSSGMTVSSLISVFDSFGSAVLVPEGGFTLNNRAAGFTTGRNACAPGRRPVHTLAPVLLETADGCVALATPGADGQVQTLLQVLSHLVVEGVDIAAAIAQPRWRGEDARLLVERSHPHRDDLAARGHATVVIADGDPRFGAIVCAGLAEGRPFCCADWRRETWAGVA